MNLSHDETNGSVKPDKAMSNQTQKPSGENDFPSAAPSNIDGNNIETQSDDKNIGLALRSAYQSMLDEAIPEEMLNLLDKLD